MEKKKFITPNGIEVEGIVLYDCSLYSSTEID